MFTQRSPLGEISANKVHAYGTSEENPFATRSRIARTPNHRSSSKENIAIDPPSSKNTTESILATHEIPIKPAISSVTRTAQAVAMSEDKSQQTRKAIKTSKSRRLSVKDVVDAIRSTPTKAKDEADIALALIGRLLPAEFREYVKRFRGDNSHETHIAVASTMKPSTPKSLLLQHLSSSPRDSTLLAQPLVAADPDADMEMYDTIADSSIATEAVPDMLPEDDFSSSSSGAEEVNVSITTNENPFKPKKALTRTPPKPEVFTPVAISCEPIVASPAVDRIENEANADAESHLNDAKPTSEEPIEATSPPTIESEMIEENQMHNWTYAELDKASEVVRRMSLHHEIHETLNPHELEALREEIDALKSELDAQRELLQQSLEDKLHLQSRIDDLESHIHNAEFKPSQPHQPPSQQQYDAMIDEELEVMKQEMERLDEIKKMILERRKHRHAQQQKLFDSIDFHANKHDSELKVATKPVDMAASTILMSPKPVFSDKLAPVIAAQCLKPIPIKTSGNASAFSSTIPKPFSSSSKDVKTSKSRDIRSDRTSFTSATVKLDEPKEQINIDMDMDFDFNPQDIPFDDPIDDQNEFQNHAAFDMAMTEVSKPVSLQKQPSVRPRKIKNHVLEDISECVKSQEKNKKARSVKYRETQLHERWKDVAVENIDGRPAMAMAGNMKFVPLQAILTTIQSHNTLAHAAEEQKLAVKKELFPDPVSSRSDESDLQTNPIDDENNSDDVAERKVKKSKRSKVSKADTAHAEILNDAQVVEPKVKRGRKSKHQQELFDAPSVDNEKEPAEPKDPRRKRKLAAADTDASDGMQGNLMSEREVVSSKGVALTISKGSQSSRATTKVKAQAQDNSAKSSEDNNPIKEEPEKHSKREARTTGRKSIKASSSSSSVDEVQDIVVDLPILPTTDEVNEEKPIEARKQARKQSRKKDTSESSALAPAAAAEPIIEERVLSPVQNSEEHHDIHLDPHEDSDDEDLILMAKPKKISRKRKSTVSKEGPKVKETETIATAAPLPVTINQVFALPLPKKKKVEKEPEEGIKSKSSAVASPLIKPSLIASLSTNRSDFSVASTTALLNTSVSSSRISTASARSGFVIPKLKKR